MLIFRNQPWNSSHVWVIIIAIFSIKGKTPEEKEILFVSVSWLEIYFLSNFNVFAEILLGSTWFKLLERMTFSISDV